MTLTTIEDEYSRAMLGKRPGKGSGHSVLDRKFDFRFLLIAFFLLVLQHFEKVVYGIQKADVACEDYGQILSNEIRLLEVWGEVPLRNLESGASSISGQAILLGEFFPYFRTSETYCTSFFSSSFLRMSGSSDRRLDLNVVEEVAMSPQDNIWRPSFGPLTIGDSVMKNDMTLAVMAKNLLTPKDNRLLSKRSDELAFKDSLAFNVQCAGFVSNMAQCLFARTRQVESLAAEVINLKQQIRGLKHENRQLHMLAHSYSTTMKRKLDQLQEFEECSLVEWDFGIALHHLQMSESGSPSDEGSPSSNSKFELAMLESSGPLLESCTKETMDDFRNCQTLANIGSSSFMSVGEPSFHQWRYCYKICPMKACPGYVECACRSERERIVFVTRGNIKLSGRELADVEKVLRVPKEDRHLGKLRPLFRNCILYFDFSCSVEKVNKKGGTSIKKGKTPMLVPVDDILFHKGAHKHRVRPAPRPKSQEEVLKITASKRAEAEAIECAAAIVAGEERRLLPHLPIIDHIFPPTIKSTNQEGDPSSSRKRKYKEEVSSIHSFRYVNNCLAGRRSIVDELGEPLDENESDRDRMMRLSSYVMTEYDNRLREVEQYKVKFKKNNQFVNDARKTSKALAEAICLKDQHFESLKRRTGENVRLKKQLERTRKQLEITILEVSKVKEELDSALVEVSELKRSAFQDAFKPHCIRAANFEKRKWMAILERYDNGSIIQKYRDKMDEYRQRGEAFVLVVNPSSEDDSDNEASVGEQSQESEDGSGDTEDGGDGDAVETQSDIVRGLASDEDDSFSGLETLLAQAQLGQQPLCQRQVRMKFLLLKFDMKCAYSIATLSGVVRTSPAPQPCWLDEPSTYRVHTGSVGSTFRVSRGDEAAASGDVKLSQCYGPFDHSSRSVRTLKYLLNGVIAHLSMVLEMNLVKAATLPVRLWMSFKVIDSFMSIIVLIFSGLHDITREAYQMRNRVIEQVFSYIKCLGSFSKHDIDQRPRVYQDSSYIKLLLCLCLEGGVEDPPCKRVRPRLVPVVVDFPGGDEFVCLSMRSFMEHSEELLILLLKDLILYRYLVVLSL
ncbi:hypothetical protein D8674_030735 [Pyrus ussuriensis x Pyrus communis]|uniref:Uncharacterized protein n=1 Tax=Pyrus ussuriensis x Pyrus communis TaxID=2448454 RepID=A0A5N5EX00_9ROSA|nr:hypothetical protein D8674_030735 [Pyrus ussuriensis x Pyrus communis]